MDFGPAVPGQVALSPSRGKNVSVRPRGRGGRTHRRGGQAFRWSWRCANLGKAPPTESAGVTGTSYRLASACALWRKAETDSGVWSAPDDQPLAGPVGLGTPSGTPHLERVHRRACRIRARWPSKLWTQNRGESRPGESRKAPRERLVGRAHREMSNALAVFAQQAGACSSTMSGVVSETG